MAKKKILVVSGDPMLIDILGTKLSADGYEVLASPEEKAPDVKAVVDRENPDLLVLDIMMPNLDGIEVCLRIRQWSRIPIIMLSTWGAGEGKVRGLNLGADGYLTQPFGSDELMVRIRGILARNLAAANLLSNIRSGVSWER